MSQPGIYDNYDYYYYPVPHLEFASAITQKFVYISFFHRICFAVGEILLLIGLSVESGHLKNWSRPRPSCLVIKEGLFSAAGVFALLTVFLAAGLYLVALRAQKISLEQENVRREVLEASAFYASPSLSPPDAVITTMARENPVRRENQLQQQPLVPSFGFSKQSNLV